MVALADSRLPEIRRANTSTRRRPRMAASKSDVEADQAAVPTNAHAPTFRQGTEIKAEGIEDFMPSIAPHPCRQPGCRAFTTATYCPAHTPKRDWRAERVSRASDPAQAEATRIRNGATWQRCRDIYKAQHPFCCDPFNIHGEAGAPTEHVHHIIPLHREPSLAYTESNLAPLCRACHDRAEAMERRGEPTSRLFKH